MGSIVVTHVITHTDTPNACEQEGDWTHGVLMTYHTRDPVVPPLTTEPPPVVRVWIWDGEKEGDRWSGREGKETRLRLRISSSEVRPLINGKGEQEP